LLVSKLCESAAGIKKAETEVQNSSGSAAKFVVLIGQAFLIHPTALRMIS